jgi:hypothetical protein
VTLVRLFPAGKVLCCWDKLSLRACLLIENYSGTQSNRRKKGL